MVEFGKKLKESRKEDWKAFYIDYDSLKKILKKQHETKSNIPKAASTVDLTLTSDVYASPKQQYQQQQQQQLIRGTSYVYTPTHLVALEFKHALDQEIEKVVLFSLQEQGNIAKELTRLSKQRNSCVEMVSVLLKQHQEILRQRSANGGGAAMMLDDENDATTAWRSLFETHQGYENVSLRALDFVAFVELNVTAVRKILKKHDKNQPHKLSQTYLSTFTSALDSHLDQLYNDGGVSALVVSLTRAFEEMHRLELNLLMMKKEARQQLHTSGNSPRRRARSTPSLLETTAFHEDDLTDCSDGGTMASNFILSRQDSVPDDLRPSVFVMELHRPSSTIMTSITNPNEPLLEKIRKARNRLNQETNYVEVIAAQALLFDDDDEDTITVEDDSQATAKTHGQRISSFLNLCSTFLYMCNYYIVAPTCGQYALLLGSSEAMAGIIIGMTPNAALIATVLYGWWSNYSYKSALIFAAGCSLIGNVCYAMALQYNSIQLVMLGRFFNGFGSARSINRRFIADTFSRSERTAASAAFVTAGALGMATGPAIAALLGRLASFPDDEELRNSLQEGDAANHLWTLETSPGWIMIGLWSVFFVATVLYFEEPDRSHLFGPLDSTTKDVTKKSNHIEKKPLLKTTEYHGDISPVKREPPLFLNIPVMTTLWIYFVLKVVLEVLLSSCATLTSMYFGWDSQASGTFLACLGLLMFPANMVVAKLSQRGYEDRELIYMTLLAMFCSILGFIDYGGRNHYSAAQYVTFGICIFLTTNLLEGPNMSLLSKTIPRSWAKGTINSGFLATEAGTAARSVGDVLISGAATFVGFSHLLNATFMPMLILVSITIILTRQCYYALVEADEEDDESRDSRSRDTSRP